MKTVFFGTPAISVPFLERLHHLTSVVAVVTKPDQPAGRGYEVRASAVKVSAIKLGVPVLQPESLKDVGFQETLRGCQADVSIVVAFGKILPKSVLEIPRLGHLNVHFSLLPRHRGAAPMQRALMAGDQETGVTIFWLDEGMDTGPIFIQKRLPVEHDETAESLGTRLVALGLLGLEEAIQRLSVGEIVRHPQQGEVTLAPPLEKEEGRIRWDWSAERIVNLVKGTTPWPGAFTTVPSSSGKPSRLKILSASVVSKESQARSPGAVVSVEQLGAVIQCGQGTMRVLRVQPEGKKPMSAWDFWQGARLKTGDLLGDL